MQIINKKENDMDLICKNIWLGNKESSLNHKALINNNIHYIINCTPNLESPFKDMKYLRLPIHDKNICSVSCGKDIILLIYKAMKFIDLALSNNSGVLVHCKKGHHRSANIILFYLVLKYNISYLRVLTVINYIRPLALVRNTCINNWGMEIYKKLIYNKYYNIN
jgi:hypothetical protein